MKVVSNSTALVHLSAAGRLELLRELFGELYIPEEVYHEVVIAGAGKPGSSEVQTADWIKRLAVKNRLAWSMLNIMLGAGEAACIVLAIEVGADLVILDDRRARLQALAHGLKITGTIGVLLMAGKEGRLDFRQALDELLATGFRLHPGEYQRILSLWQSENRTDK